MYDLGDASKWEFMFSTTDKPLLMIPSVDETDPLDFDDEEVYYSLQGGGRDTETYETRTLWGSESIKLGGV